MFDMGGLLGRLHCEAIGMFVTSLVGPGKVRIRG